MKKINNITGNKILFFDGRTEYRLLKAKLHQALDEVGESGQWLLGKYTERLEEELAKITQTKYLVACASGTDAISLSLLALKIKPGDEVIVPANSYPTVFGVAAVGAKPILIDVDPQTANLDWSHLPSLINKKTKAIIMVHLYGQPADIEEVSAIAKKYSVSLIEDCAQSLGATYKNKSVGSFGTMGIYSFYPTKVVGALGDAGAVATNNSHLYQKLRMLRIYGEKERYDSRAAGINSRIDEIQAAFLLKKLSFLRQSVEKRRKLAKLYYRLLGPIKEIQLPYEKKERKHVYHLFVIKTPKRDKLKRWLAKQGIQTAIHYPRAIHQTKAFNSLGRIGDFPEAERWSKTALSLPLHPFIDKDDIDYIANQVKAFFK